jgi:hypothetical protein
MIQTRYIILGIFIILLLAVAGCTTANAVSRNENTNFHVVWSEQFENGDGLITSHTLTKLDIPNDNRECYVVFIGGGTAMQCFNKTG